MSYRAKQATVALNLLALVMVGLLYRMDSDVHIADQKAYSEAKTSELTGPKDETPPPLPDTGIKMVDIDLPSPPPVVVAQNDVNGGYTCDIERASGKNRM